MSLHHLQIFFGRIGEFNRHIGQFMENFAHRRDGRIGISKLLQILICRWVFSKFLRFPDHAGKTTLMGEHPLK